MLRSVIVSLERVTALDIEKILSELGKEGEEVWDGT